MPNSRRTGREGEALVAVWFYGEAPRLGHVRPHLRDPPRPSPELQRLEQPQVDDEPDEGRRPARERHVLPRRAHVDAGERGVELGERERRDAQERVRDTPRLVAEPQGPSRERHDDQAHHRERREQTREGRRVARQRAQQRGVGRAPRDEHQGVREHEQRRQDADLPVVLHDEIDAERLADTAETRDQRELERELPQPDEAERDRELEPEGSSGRRRRREPDEQRDERQQDVESDEERARSPVQHVTPGEVVVRRRGQPA